MRGVDSTTPDHNRIVGSDAQGSRPKKVNCETA
jgi:hypothetical protein